MTRAPMETNYRAPQHAFAQRYTVADVALLAAVDRAIRSSSGPATACVLCRQRDICGDARFERLGSIAVAHLYSLRSGCGYRAQRVVLSKTRSDKAAPIGVRKAQAPDERPGFVRIDSMHQSDFDGIKGLYHTNAVDCVIQWEIMASVHTIAQSHLVPVIEQMLAQFPFEILGFHADNGSTYVNRRVTQMLDERRIVFTRSCPRRSNDNGLAETKNGAVMRKVFGYAHIPQRHAARFNTFCLEYLKPFLSFHRPCRFATELPDPKKPGRIERVYRAGSAMTPLDRLASLPEAHRFLRAGATLEPLQQLARASERRAGRRGAQRGPCRAVSVGACACVTSRKCSSAGATRALRARRAMDKWTMRLRRTGLDSRTTLARCPPPTPFARLPTARHRSEQVQANTLPTPRIARRGPHHPSQGAPGSSLAWKRFSGRHRRGRGLCRYPRRRPD